MTDALPDRTALRALRPLEVAAYLRARGWREARPLEGRGAVWTNQHNGEPYEVLQAFGEHVERYLWRPSGRAGRGRNSGVRAGLAGRFTYEPPAEVRLGSVSE